MKKIIFVCLFFGVLGCTDETAKKIETLNSELLLAHDAIMPKTLRIDALKKEVLEKASNNKDSTGFIIAEELQRSSDEMYDWMKEYGEELRIEKKSNEKLIHFQSLESEINQIGKETDLSIEKAKNYLK